MDPSKKSRRSKKKTDVPKNETPDESGNNIFEMLNQVNKLLKQNPDMLKHVNKCVSGIIDNPEIMETLTAQINKNITLSSEPVSSEPISSEPASSEPASSEPISSEPVNSTGSTDPDSLD
jgi:hypothetical protein